MRKIIQKCELKVIKPQIVHYFCDKCGERIGTRKNPKKVIYRATSSQNDDGEFHYCRKCFKIVWERDD